MPETSSGVVVGYRGRLGPIRDADGSIEGWAPTRDGAFVVGEPRGSPTWFPSNDHPTHKAACEFRITVPKRRKAFANGVLVERVKRPRTTTFVWREDDPSYVAVDPREARAARRPLGELPGMMEQFASAFGPYPFSSTGAIVARARRVGYALETQTRPTYDRAPSEATVAHELAHQWTTRAAAAGASGSGPAP